MIKYIALVLCFVLMGINIFYFDFDFGILSNENRISISGDISIMLKSSIQSEHLLPNPNFWQKF